MWFWWHDYFASKNHIIAVWVNINYLSAEFLDRGLYLHPQDYVSLGIPAKIYNWIFSWWAKEILMAGLFSDSWNWKNRWWERILNRNKIVQNWREHILHLENKNSNENSGVQKVRNWINRGITRNSEWIFQPREPRHHDLGPWQMLPWRYRAKPLGVGRQWLILFLCVVLYVVCVCDVFYLSILGGESG